MSKKLILVAALLAAGCAQETSPAGDTAGPAVGPVEAAAADPAAECPEPRYSPLPAAVAFDRDFLVRTDKVYVTRAGGERRRTSLEILDGDAQAIAREVVADLVAQGARELDVEDRGDGTLRLAVNQRGVGRINVSATDDRGANPAHPRSVGIVAFDWPLSGGDDADAEADGATGEAQPEPEPVSDPVG